MYGCHMQPPYNPRRPLILLLTVPGWSRVEQYAKDTWGTGDWDIIINPPGVSELYVLTNGFYANRNYSCSTKINQPLCVLLTLFE